MQSFNPIEIAGSALLFFVIWLFFGRKVLKPYVDLLEEREARTVGDVQRAGEKDLLSNSLTEKIETSLKEARLQGIIQRDEFVTKAKVQASELIGGAQEAAQVELARSRQALSDEKVRARGELNHEAEQLCELVLDRVLTTSQPPTMH